MYQHDFLLFNDICFGDSYWHFKEERFMGTDVLPAIAKLQKDGWEVVCSSHFTHKVGYLMRKKVG